MATSNTKNRTPVPDDFDRWTSSGYGIKVEKPNGKRKAIVRKIDGAKAKKSDSR